MFIHFIFKAWFEFAREGKTANTHAEIQTDFLTASITRGPYKQFLRLSLLLIFDRVKQKVFWKYQILFWIKQKAFCMDKKVFQMELKVFRLEAKSVPNVRNFFEQNKKCSEWNKIFSERNK